METYEKIIPLFVAPEGKVLIVDDNKDNLIALEGLLKETRLLIDTASSGKECLELLRREIYNLVLLDHFMPEMDGIETLQEIRKTIPDLPVLALTASEEDNPEEFYRQAGFQGYLPKPVDQARLEETIMYFIPEELFMDPDESSKDIAENEDQEEKNNYEYLDEIKGISVDDGVNFCGRIDFFVKFLTTFATSIDDKAKEIETAFYSNDWELYTIKVHALKSTARIIGAKELSELARNLEQAGKEGNTDFINEKTQHLLELYRSYKEKLRNLLK